MRTWLVAAMVFLVAGAGCSDAASKKPPATDFSDVDIKVSDSTGAIRGVVVDERIIPVEDALVTLTGPDPKTTTTDEQGRFVFDQLEPGTYFLQVRSPRHKDVQASAEVEAGVADPPLTRIQLQRLFTQDPFVVDIKQDGFFECTMAGPGPWYGSAMCADYIFGPTVTNAQPGLRNLTRQNREWHMDVDAGWQTIVVEMDWKPTAQGTSERMGIVVSTYKPTRNGLHQFAHLEGAAPIYGRLDVGVPHATSRAGGTDPVAIPAEGWANVSYFAGVRQNSNAPAVSYNQEFKVYIHQFYFGVAPDGWSFVRGDAKPF